MMMMMDRELNHCRQIADQNRIELRPETARASERAHVDRSKRLRNNHSDGVMALADCDAESAGGGDDDDVVAAYVPARPLDDCCHRDDVDADGADEDVTWSGLSGGHRVRGSEERR